MRKEFEIDAIKLVSGKTTLDSEITLDADSYNAIATEIQGTGPRYGMSLIPGQAVDEDITLRSAEGTTAGYSNRKNIFGITFARSQRLGVKKAFPIFICASDKEVSGVTSRYVDLIFTGDANGPDSDIAGELLDDPLGSADYGLKNWRLNGFEDARKKEQLPFLSWAQISISLGEMQAPWLLGDIVSGETATNPGKLRFSKYGYDYSMQSRKANNVTIASVFTDTAKRYFGRRFIWDNANASWTSPLKENEAATHLELANADRTQDRLTTPTYTSGELALQYVDGMTMSQAHSVIAIATGSRGLLAVIRDERDENYGPVQYADASVSLLQSTRTLDETGAASYLEAGVEKATAWAYVPTWTGAALAAEGTATYDGAIHVRLGAAGSGLLRAELDYEIGYALYDVTTGVETNVGTPFRITTDADDYVAVSIFRNVKSGGIFKQACACDLNVPFQKIDIKKVNYIQYRFYYRPIGSQEWLPAGHFWAANLLYNGANNILWIATSAIGATIGGDPGQFNDYSPLPVGDWFNVEVFQSRLFWIATKQAIFSLKNNAFAYPIRNAVSLPSMEFRGCTIHTFYGQSQQTGKVIFWANDAQYEGAFTGNQAIVPVTVSPDYTAQFPLDGSDFVVQFRSKFTAFSYRAAVVAEGALFFWGEAGIFADDGVNQPRKISQDIEPWLDKVYDTGQIKAIHCVYNESPKEIIWFYKPRVNSGFGTEAIVFNAEKNAFQRIGLETDIDWSQNVNLTQEGARKRLTCGKRILLGHTFGLYPQRPVFFDNNNLCGDIKHGTEYMVTALSRVGTHTRLQIANGPVIPFFADLQVGDHFLIHQSFEYTENEASYNGRYTIADIGTFYIDIEEQLEPATFSRDKYLPIWIDRFAEIPYSLKTRYIVPKDRWGLIQITEMNMFFRLISTIASQVNCGIFTNVSDTEQSIVITVEKNANSHCIRSITIANYDDTTHGIGFGFRFHGRINGASWRLDWLGVEFDAGENLLRFGE